MWIAEMTSAQPAPRRIQLAATEMETARLIGQQEGVGSVAISADGKIAVSGSFEGLICVWDLTTNKFVRTLRAHTSHGVELAITPDGSRCVSKSADKQFCVWDVKTGDLLLHQKSDETSNNLLAVAISDDGKTAAFSQLFGTVKIFDVDQDKLINTVNIGK